MLNLNYPYEDLDGMHWPDTFVGSEEFYCFNFADYINQENNVIVNCTWVLPKGITGSDDGITDIEAFIKLVPTHIGTFEIRCQLRMTETTPQSTVYEETRVLKMFLKVT